MSSCNFGQTSLKWIKDTPHDRFLTEIVHYRMSKWCSTPPFLLLPIWPRSNTIQEYLNCTRFCQLQVLDGFLVCRVEKLLEVCAHIAWLGLGMKTQRHCFQWSNPLYSNSTAFLSHIPKPRLLCEGFFPFKKKKGRKGRLHIFIWFTMLTLFLAPKLFCSHSSLIINQDWIKVLV